MIIHLRQIGEIPRRFSGREAPDRIGLADAGAQPAGELEYNLEAGMSGGGLWVRGTLRLPVRLTCVCCLETFATTVEVPDFLLQLQLDGREQVDLTEWVREDIFLALPPHPRCDASGGRKCPAAFPPAENAPDHPGSGAVPSAWAALDRIQTKHQT